MRELRILIADDHELIRRGVRDLLAARADWQVVGEAHNGAEAVKQAERLRPDVAILDFSMPLMNGPAAAAQIAKLVPKTSFVVLTMHDSKQVVQQVLQAGVRGLVLKTDAVHNLLEAVEAVSEKQHFYPAWVSKLLLAGTLTGGTASTPGLKSKVTQLTARESEIMRLLAHGMTNKAVATRLRISMRTVETHRVNINRKLGLHSIADLVSYAIKNGMMIPV